MRFPLILLALTSAAITSASYEMMLIPSSDDYVYRFDPANRIGLGQFSTFNPTFVVTQSGTGTAWVGNSGIDVVRPYDYSTGFASNISRTFTSSANVILSGTKLVSADGANLRTYDITTNALTSVPIAAPMTGARAIVAVSSNRYVVIGFNAAHDVVGYLANSSLTALGSVATLLQTADVDVSSDIGGAITVNAGTERIAFTYRTTADLHVVTSTSISGTTLTTPVTLTSSSGHFNVARVPTLVPSHDGFYVVGPADTLTMTNVMRYEMTTATSTGYLGESTLNVPCPTSMTVGMVAAPEPGTMVALGLGLAAILRRRRR